MSVTSPTEPSGFEADSAVRPGGDAGVWLVDVHPGWSVAGRTNGGYLLAVAARAALAEAADPRLCPLAVAAAFSSPAPAGPGEIHVEVVRSGRSTTVLRARVVSQGQTCLDALVTAGRLVDGEPVVPGPARPDMPAEEGCVRLPVEAPGGMRVPLLGQVHERLDPACAGWTRGHPSGAGELRAWIRLGDGSDFDPVSLVMAVDCLPPPTFDLADLGVGWVPTLQLSAFVRAAPAPGPLVVRSLARSVGGGAVDETCDVWDSTGRLVAVGHQLAAYRQVRRTTTPR